MFIPPLYTSFTNLYPHIHYTHIHTYHYISTYQYIHPFVFTSTFPTGPAGGSEQGELRQRGGGQGRLRGAGLRAVPGGPRGP